VPLTSSAGQVYVNKRTRRAGGRHFRVGPELTHAPQQTASLFDHLVGGREHSGRHGEAERLRGLEVDDQLELGGLLHRQVSRFLTFENPADVDTGQTRRLTLPGNTDARPLRMRQKLV